MFVATPVQSVDDPVLSLHREALLRRASGRRCIDATLGVLVDDAGTLVVLPAVAEAVHDMRPADWAPYANSYYTMTARDWAEVAAVLDRYAADAPIAVVLDSVYACRWPLRSASRSAPCRPAMSPCWPASLPPRSNFLRRPTDARHGHRDSAA